MDQKVKFAKLVAKLGVYFGAADGNYDDKERAFVNLFIGFLKTQSGMTEDVENIIRETTNEKYKLEDLVAETNDALKHLTAEERKGTIDSINSFIETIIGIDGKKCTNEEIEFNHWKEAVKA